MILLLVLLSVIITGIGFTLIGICIVAKKLGKRKILEKCRDHRFSVGIFHPFCTFGNPEERILWGVLSALQSKYPHYRYIVYTGDIDSPPEKILSIAKLKLNVTLASPVEFVYLQKRHLVDPVRYPRFPRLSINFGSIGLALEAIWKFIPDVYFDTVGYTFMLPIFKYLGKCRVGCYLSMSPDILHAFSNRGYNNQNSRNKYVKILQKITQSKLYRSCYSWAGQCSEVILVNSSWTENYINRLINCESKVSCVYPPCPVEKLEESIVRDEDDTTHVQIISLGQFWSHADHPLQIRTLFQLRQIVSEKEWERIQLVFVGTCNSTQDSARVKDMEDLCKHLSVEENVVFKLNLPYDEVMKELEKSLIAIHTMNCDPFGIGVVECMAAGVITVAHNSGAITKDITVDHSGCRNAFLASDELEYADAIKHIIYMRNEAKVLIRNQAKLSVDRFSESQFKKTFLDATDSFFK